MLENLGETHSRRCIVCSERTPGGNGGASRVNDHGRWVLSAHVIRRPSFRSRDRAGEDGTDEQQ